MGEKTIKERAKRYLKYWRLPIRSCWSKVEFIHFIYRKFAFVCYCPRSCAWKRKDRVSIGHPQDSRHAVCLYLTAVFQVHASTSDLREVPWWILIFQNFESEKGCRWHQDNRLELQMSWSNRDIWSLCPWWLRLSTGLLYWLPYKSNWKKKSNCNLHPVTMNSGMVECWRTGSGSKYQQGHFLANLREELCLGPWFHQLLSPQLNWVLCDWTEPEVQVSVTM